MHVHLGGVGVELVVLYGWGEVVWGVVVWGVVDGVVLLGDRCGEWWMG